MGVVVRMISSLVDVVFLLPEVFVYRMRYFKAKSVPMGADSGLGLDPVYLPPGGIQGVPRKLPGFPIGF